jgi:hypothetical protein
MSSNCSTLTNISIVLAETSELAPDVGGERSEK